MEVKMCTCNSCNSDNVTEHSENETYSYKNTDYQVLTYFLVCNVCNDEFMNKEQILKNETNIREAKKKIDGLLSSSELKEARMMLKLTQEQASEVFGGGRNAFSKYERSEVSQSKSMDKLIRLAKQDRYIYRKLIGLSDIEQTFDFTDPMDLQVSNTNIVIFPSKEPIKISSYKIEGKDNIDFTDLPPTVASC